MAPGADRATAAANRTLTDQQLQDVVTDGRLRCDALTG